MLWSALHNWRRQGHCGPRLDQYDDLSHAVSHDVAAHKADSTPAATAFTKPNEESWTIVRKMP